DPSFWYYLGSVDGLQHGYQYGQNGDFPAPGDFDGDNKYDYTVQRNAGSGQAAFYTHKSSGGADSVTIFGTPTDVIVPGYYDADCKTDIATIRGVSGSIQWNILNSTTGTYTFYTFGSSATDFPTQGDWDGDGKTDIGVWRPNADPSMDFF